MIKIQNLTKEYGSFKAIDSLNLEINSGEVFGLIGHNGAGKTTTIKSLVGINSTEQGSILIDGIDIAREPLEAKKLIGYVSDSPDKFLNLTTYRLFEFIANIFGIQNEERDERINELCEKFDMQDAKYKFIENLSHGMRQKAFVIAALLSDPKVWILDEPMTGLDPKAQHTLKAMIREHADSGNTVLFSSHVLEVTEKLCDRIGILKKGKLIYVGTVEELKSQHEGKTLEDIYLSLTEEVI